MSPHENAEVIISVAVNMAIKNPRYYNWCMAVVSVMLDFCNKRTRVRLIKDIKTRFNSIPNTGLLDLWLHRVSIKIDDSIVYGEPLTKLVDKSLSNTQIWDCNWVKKDIKNIVDNAKVVDEKVLAEMSVVISPPETDKFNDYHIS